MERRVEPEILDELPAAHPDAIRSRRDLRGVNRLMGNESWIFERVMEHPEAATEGVVELGAGEGVLLERFARAMPDVRLTAVDLAPRSPSLDSAIQWRSGDVFAEAPSLAGGILVANLFLHHFEREELARLGELAARFRVLCFVEPLRWKVASACGRLIFPFVNHVTRHDMLVSIRAGFVPGELTEWLGLDAAEWRISERSSWRGGLRVLACRH